jgi:hypothetical protein
MKLFLVHAAGLALTVLGIIRSGERPPVLVYAFILDYGLRLLTIRLMLRALAGGTPGMAAGVGYVTRSPAPGESSHPFVDEETRQPVAFSVYVVLLLFFGTLAMVLANVNAQHTLDVDADTLIRDVRWAVSLAGVYWLQAMIAQAIVIDPAASIETNLGYNNHDLTLLAFAMLGAGAVVVTRQIAGTTSSGWVVLGPLLLFRFLFDLSAARRTPAR